MLSLILSEGNVLPKSLAEKIIYIFVALSGILIFAYFINYLLEIFSKY